MARILTTFNNFLNRFKDTSGEELLLLPENIKKGLSINLKHDEGILISILTDRAIYKAGHSRDSNTFYRSYAVLTVKRLILLKQSSQLNIFREFETDSVKGILYEVINNKPTVHIDLGDSKYILSMPPGSSTEAKQFFERFNSAIGNVEDKLILCVSCGNKIQKDSVYCSYCGKKISVIGNEND